MVRGLDAVGETGTLSVPAEPDAITVDVIQATGRKPRTPLKAYTAKTTTDPRALDAELERVRRRRWADAYEEREPELNAIAAPVFANGGEAISRELGASPQA